MLNDLLRGVNQGQFSPVERHGETAQAYYLAAEKKMSPEALDTIKVFANHLAGNESRNTITSPYRLAVVQGLGIVFRLP